jgi:hypothetical protein
MLIQTADSADAALIAEGWERRFTADPARAKEAIELYLQLGYEVHAESVRASGLRDECGGCHEVALQLKTIYTRKKSE